jgi:hypothetical protein
VTRDFTRYGFDAAAGAAAQLHAFAVAGTGTGTEAERADALVTLGAGLDAAGEVCDP